MNINSFEKENKTFDLGDIAEIIMGQSPSGDSYNKEGQGVPLINGPTEFGKKYPKIIQWTTKPTKYCEAGDLLLCVRGSSIGRINISNGKYCIGRGVAAIRPKGINLDTHFLNYLIERKVSKILINSSGSTFPNLSSSELKNFKVTIPDIDAQSFNGSFIFNLDTKIQLQQEKIDLLKEQKKGYMQKVFSRELRFKDVNGKTYRDWKEYKFRNIGSTFTGLSGKTKDDFGYGDHSFITYTNVFNNLFASKNGLEKVNVLEDENQAVVKKGDILLTTSSETPQEVGMASIWKHSMEKVHLNSFCFGYRLNQDKNILPEFVAISLRSDYMRRKIILLAQGSTRFNMSKTELMLQTIKIPCVEEQQKIVNFYKTLDQQLHLAKEQLEYLKTQKQAFLQQMFV